MRLYRYRDWRFRVAVAESGDWTKLRLREDLRPFWRLDNLILMHSVHGKRIRVAIQPAPCRRLFQLIAVNSEPPAFFGLHDASAHSFGENLMSKADPDHWSFRRQRFDQKIFERSHPRQIVIHAVSRAGDDPAVALCD